MQDVCGKNYIFLCFSWPSKLQLLPLYRIPFYTLISKWIVTMLPLKIFLFLFYDWIYNWKHCSAVFIDISVVEFREKQGFIKISIKHTHFLLDTAPLFTILSGLKHDFRKNIITDILCLNSDKIPLEPIHFILEIDRIVCTKT